MLNSSCIGARICCLVFGIILVWSGSTQFFESVAYCNSVGFDQKKHYNGV